MLVLIGIIGTLCMLNDTTSKEIRYTKISTTIKLNALHVQTGSEINCLTMPAKLEIVIVWT